LGWEAWFVISIVVLVLFALVRTTAPADLVMIGAVVLIALVGHLSGTDKLPTLKKVVGQFGDPAPVTVGFLFILVAGLELTGAMEWVMGRFLGRPKTLWSAQARLLPLVAGISGLLNNTTVVAAMIPVAADLAKKARIAASKLYLPMNYATILGGVCTMIGTSTNLVAGKYLAAHRGVDSVPLFEISWVGIPVAIVGVTYLFIAGRYLLPDRKPAISLEDDPRRYTVEMSIDPHGPLVGRTIEEAGLRHLPALFLTEIERDNQLLAAPSPSERLLAGDVLRFAGVLDSVIDLQKIRGLLAAGDQTQKLSAPTHKRRLIEAVVSNRSPMLGQSIREGRFRSRYNAAIIAIARGGERIEGKLGDVVLEPGDTLLLEASLGFQESHRRSADFFLVRTVEDFAPRRHDRAPIAIAILAVVVALATFELVDMLLASMIGAILMILTRCCRTSEARRSIDWSTLIVIAGSLALGEAMGVSGAANGLASGILGLAGGSPWWSLVAIYVATLITTEMVTNNAAAALMMPLAIGTAKQLGIDPSAFAFCVMIAASCGFATPFGYQTNLMVYGPGGYRFSDYIRLGLPLDLICMAVAVTVIPLVWSLK
jgi:di/tricarboxylate transporter